MTTSAPPVNSEDHLELVRHIVHKLHPASEEEREEMYSDGVVGLVDACGRFDSDRGLALSTFLAPRIRGAILDGKRVRDPLARSMRKRVKAIRAVETELRTVHGREPTRSEIVVASDLTDQQYDGALRAQSAISATSFDAALHDDTTTLHDVVGHNEGRDEDGPDSGDVRWLLGKLVGQQRYVITRRFLYEEKLHVIAAEMGVTESRVSQIVGKALAVLKGVAGSLETRGRDGAPTRRSRKIRKAVSYEGEATTDYLMREIGDRLEALGMDRSPHCMTLFLYGLEGGRRVNDIAADTGVHRRSWSRRMKNRGLGCPQHWIQAGHLARWLYLMWQSNATLRETARQIGGECSSMSKLCKVATGLRPSGVVALFDEVASPWPIADALTSYLAETQP